MTTETLVRTALEASAQAYAAGQGVAPAQNIPNGFSHARSVSGVETGFRAEIYKNGSGELFVALTGTEGSALDAFADLNVGWTQWQAHGQQLLNAIADLQQQNPGATVHFTGHSLGGALAQFATYEYRRINEGASASLTTFNALGGLAALRQNLSLSLAQINATISGVDTTHFRVRDDIVTRLGEGHIGGNVVELDLRPLPGVALSFLDAHVLPTIEAALSNGQQLTEAVPVNVSYLNVIGAQRFTAALSNLGSNNSFNEAEAGIRLIGALILGIQFSPAGACQ